MLTSQLTTHINAFWKQEILPALHEYIRVPNESPLFDPDWQAHGHMQRAVALVVDWMRQQHIPGGTLEVLQDGEVAATARAVIVAWDEAARGARAIGEADRERLLDGDVHGARDEHALDVEAAVEHDDVGGEADSETP